MKKIAWERTRKDGDVIGLYEDSGNGEIGEWTGGSNLLYIR